MNWRVQVSSQPSQSVCESDTFPAQEVQAYPFMYSPTVRVWLIDTPGFNDTSRSETEVLQMIASYMRRTYALNLRLHRILYFHELTVCLFVSY
jgi:hypothetical protein